jgi:hypothetical protein
LENDQHHNSSLYEENLNNIFNFSDLFFNQTETRFSPDLDSSLLDSHSWSNVLNTLLEPESFHILTLNINSIFNKFEHVFKMLSSVYCDIMVFSEIKLDDTIPDKLYEHPDFFLIRRNRTMSGGGILIYVRKSYKIFDLFISTEFELVSFKLKII